MKEHEGEQGEVWTFEDARERQLRRGLAMTPAERLRWLEETMAEMRRFHGAARRVAAEADSKA